MGYMYGEMVENTKDYGIIIKCTEKGFSCGRMARNIQVSTMKIKRRDTENFNGNSFFILTRPDGTIYKGLWKDGK